MASIHVEENAAKAKQTTNDEQETFLMIVLGKTEGLFG
jgi:hypothetical protein